MPRGERRVTYPSNLVRFWYNSSVTVQSVPMHPDFDSFVTRLEQRLVPEMTDLADALHSSWPDFEIKTISLRHSEGVHTLGLWCSARTQPVADTVYPRGIIINVLGFEGRSTGLSVRGFVQWDVTRPSDRPHCVIINEQMTRVYTPQSKGGIDTFVEAAPILHRALRRAFRRGRPPGPVVRLWHRLRDRVWNPVF